MAERTLAVLRLDGRPVADYVDGAGLEANLSPRPYLHPVRTLAGIEVTDIRPADHRWHLGVGVAVPDVAGWNFWGGPTYVRGRGYVWRDDHGRIEHTGFAWCADDGFAARLHWRTPHGELLLAEERTVRARPVGYGWELELVTTLVNAADRPVRLGSPATNGRAGAGYGGFFWRLPPARTPHVDSAAGWLTWTDRAAGFTLVFAATDHTDPWFVRVEEYPGVGSQLAARDPLTLQPGDAATRGFRTLVADGVLDNRLVARWRG